MTIGDKINRQEYINKANRAEEKYGIPQNLLAGLLHAESRFNPKAVSPAGARGIAQFLPSTAKAFGIDPYNVDQAIDAAGKYLSQNFKKLGNWEDTLRSYNMGLGNVYKWKQGRIKLPKETADYVGRVYEGVQAVAGNKPVFKQPTVGQLPTVAESSTYVPAFINYGEIGNTPQVATTTEDTKEEVEAKEAIDKVSAQKQILQDYFTIQTPQQVAQVQQQEIEPSEQFPTISEQYAQVSQLINQPIAQQGGIPVSSRGVYDYPQQEVIVPTSDGRITMRNVEYPILATDEYGNQQMMMPNEEYQFKGKIIHEIPQLKNYFNKR